MTGKRPLLVGVLIILSAPAAEAVDFGFKAGVHWATLPGYTGPLGGLGSGSTRNLSGGPLVAFPLAGVLALQPEALFVKKGTVLKAENPQLDLKTTLVFEYLEFPILARIATNQPGPTSFYALVGPSFGYMVRARERIESLGQESERELDTIARFEASLVVGGGIRVRWLLAECRYSQGLTTVDAEQRTDFKNRGIAVLVGFQL
ncbi:MAG TPA: porin family protein [Vicinamibacteria bacterium]|nr:porin family protein [Vicinamibacteria bacterium]